MVQSGQKHLEHTLCRSQDVEVRVVIGGLHERCVQCASVNMSEMVHDDDVVTIDHCQELI